MLLRRAPSIGVCALAGAEHLEAGVPPERVVEGLDVAEERWSRVVQGARLDELVL